MNDKQRAIVSKVAGELFRKNREFILKEWLTRVNEEIIETKDKEFHIITIGFENLINDFINFLSNGDIKRYYEGNARVAESIAYNDISLDNFITAFHLFEDSYIPLLFKLPKDELVKYINALDRLHHKTISIICEKYFEVKDNTIITLTKLIELRDYSVLLAKELGCGGSFIEEISKASLLHDIGKVGIRDSVLLKPEKLTVEEFEEVKKHTTIGAQTIGNIIGGQAIYTGYLIMAREIALYHHERYDGNGYPEGLKKDNIPLAARILAVADAYDAIVSARPYKVALPHEEAIRRIKMDSGHHFDHEIVEAFLRINDRFIDVRGNAYGFMLDA